MCFSFSLKFLQASTPPFCEGFFFKTTFMNTYGQLPSEWCTKMNWPNIIWQYYIWPFYFCSKNRKQRSFNILKVNIAVHFLTLSVYFVVVCANGGTFVIPPSSTVYTSAEENVLLPCKFLPADGEVVIQVIWNHVKTDGTEVQVITAHRQEGQQGTKCSLYTFVGSKCLCWGKKEV